MALNMADLFEHAVDTFPDRVALICGDRHVTYTELDDEANRLAHHLAAQGVGRGDHVGLYARNSVETVETLLATIKLRAASININYRYLRDELAYHLRDADLSALVHDQDLAPVVDAVLSRGLPRVAIGADVAEALSFGPMRRRALELVVRRWPSPSARTRGASAGGTPDARDRRCARCARYRLLPPQTLP